MSLISSRATRSLLEELDTQVKAFGNQTLNDIVSEFWPEFVRTIRTIGFPHHNKTLARRAMVALFASKVFLQVGSLTDSLLYAFAASDFFDVRLFDTYTEKIIYKFIDSYTRLRVEAQDCTDSSSSKDIHLENIINCMLQKCKDTKNYRLVLDLALRTRRMDFFYSSIKSLDNMNEVLLHAIQVTMCTFDNYSFRTLVLDSLISIYQIQIEIDYLNMSKCFIFLDRPKSVALLLETLIQNNNKKSCLIAYQIAHDLYELATQGFLSYIFQLFKSKNLKAVNQCSEEKYNSSNFLRSHDQNFDNLSKVMCGDAIIDQNSLFLSRNNHTDIFILNNIKYKSRTCICHTATLIANGFMNTGTTSDQFLRDYLELANWATWEKLSAIVTLGMIHRGHETNAIELMRCYLSSKNDSSGYYECGSLYALGLIHGNHGAAINDYILGYLKSTQLQIVKHGGCLGIGLSAMGTCREDIYEELKLNMYNNDPVFGEAVGIGMGLVMFGSKNNKALIDMVSYIQVTQHIQVLRGLAVGISFLMYNQLDNADLLISSLLQDKNPILRCSAMYTISMAYCGTGSETIIKKILHIAYSDTSDEVRRAAVTSLGFLLFRTPHQCIQIVSILTKSYNPYIRYGSAMALGIACAGTGFEEAIYLLEPMTKDLVNFVRQGAMLASAMIYINKTEKSCFNAQYFRMLYSKVIADEKGDTVDKFGAILAQGIIDGGGRNVSISLESRTGHINMLTVVALQLFIQYQYSIFLSHCLSLAFTPTCDFELNTQLETPTLEMRNIKQVKRQICSNSLYQGLAEQRGWLQYLFKQGFQEIAKFKYFNYDILIPKIVDDINIIKSNWKSNYFQLQKINCYSENTKGVNCLQFDVNKIVSGLQDSTIKIWDKNTLKCIMVLTGHIGSVLCLQFDDQVIVSGSYDRTVRVWDIITGKVINTLFYHHEAVLHLKFNNNMMITSSKDQSIAVWYMISPNKITLTNILIGHQAAINMVDFDDKYIVSASEDNTIKVWNKSSFEFLRSLIGHTSSITSFQYRGRLIISASYDKTIRLWDIDYGTCLRILENSTNLFCVKFNSKIIISGGYGGIIKIWNLEAALDPSVPASSLCIRTLAEHTDNVFQIQFDKLQMVSCSKDDTIIIWNYFN